MTFAPWFWRPSSSSKHQFCSRSQFHDVEIKRFRIVAELSCRSQCFSPQTGRLPDLSIFTTSLPPNLHSTELYITLCHCGTYYWILHSTQWILNVTLNILKLPDLSISTATFHCGTYCWIWHSTVHIECNIQDYI